MQLGIFVRGVVFNTAVDFARDAVPLRTPTCTDSVTSHAPGPISSRARRTTLPMRLLSGQGAVNIRPGVAVRPQFTDGPLRPKDVENPGRWAAVQRTRLEAKPPPSRPETAR